MSDSVSHEAASSISDALEAVAESNARLHAALQQNNQIMIQAMTMLAEAINRPRKIVMDASGKPIGSEPA